MDNQQPSLLNKKVQRLSEEQFNEVREFKILHKKYTLKETIFIEKEIIELYTVQKYSLKEIAKVQHMSREKVRKILLDNNVEILKRGRGASKNWTQEEVEKLKELFIKGYSYRILQQEFECGYQSIKNKIIELGLTRRSARLKNHDINSDFFHEINTEEKAYFLGFIITDGSVRNHQLRFQLKKEDRYMVEKLKECLNSDVKIVEDKREGKKCVGFEINDDQIVEDLAKYDVIPNKTYLMNSIPFEKIPKNLQNHFVRGLIDGDGTITYEQPEYLNIPQLIIGFCGYSEEYIHCFQNFINKTVLDGYPNSKILKNNAWSCKWKGNKLAMKICDWMYEDAHVYLTRKKEKYLYVKSQI